MKKVLLLSVGFLGVLAVLLIRTNGIMEKKDMFTADGTLKKTVSLRLPANQICHQENNACRTNSDCCSHNCTDNICSPRVITKGIAGESCEDDSDCLTNHCSQFLKCAPTEDNKAEIGQFCMANNSLCKSGYCDTRHRVCKGTQVQMAYVGQFCETNSECLSKKCDLRLKKCLGGGIDFAQENELCTNDDQCDDSRKCHPELLRCQ